MALYSEKVMDHFRNPRNVGVIEDADGVGEVGNAKCGDIMKIYLKIKDGIIDVEAARHGLRGSDCVEISGGFITVQAGEDGIRSKDYVKIGLAAVTVDAGRYGIFGLKKVQVDPGSKVEVNKALSPVSSSGTISLAYPLTDQGKE